MWYVMVDTDRLLKAVLKNSRNNFFTNGDSLKNAIDEEEETN